MDLLGAWRWAFKVSALLALAAGLMLFAGASDTETWFSWSIEPAETAAFLGAAYWAVVILFAWASTRGSWSEMRLGASAEATAAVLLAIATLLHLGKFHDDLFGYFWRLVYPLAAPLLVALLVAAQRQDGKEVPEPASRQLPRGLEALLAVQALIFAAYGVALFLFPETIDAAWPWALTPLTARTVAAFLLGFAVAAFVALLDRSVDRLRGAAWTYLALGMLEILGAVLHDGDFSSREALAGFIVCFAIVAATGAWGLLYAERSSARALSAS